MAVLLHYRQLLIQDFGQDSMIDSFPFPIPFLLRMWSFPALQTLRFRLVGVLPFLVVEAFPSPFHLVGAFPFPVLHYPFLALHFPSWVKRKKAFPYSYEGERNH